MANRNNVVFNVLPTNSNTAILAKDNTVGDLTPGKIGFFDAETGNSFDNTSTVPDNFFIAIGTPDGGFRKSAGQNVQKDGILGFQKKEYQAGSPMTATISGFKPKYDSEYGIRVEFRNSHIYRIQGHNQFSKAYIVRTPNQVDCGGDECLDPLVLAKSLKQEVNLDENDLLTAVLTVDQAVTAVNVDGIDADLAIGDEITDEQVDALVAHNAANTSGFTASIVLTPNVVDGGSFTGGINLNYHKLLQTVIIVSPLSTLNYSGTKVISTSPVYAEGTGANILQKEYHASSWNGAGPYAVSTTTNTAIGNIEYLADKNVNYTQYALEYDVVNEGGWLSYKNPLTTIIAVPQGHSSLLTSLDSMMGKLV